VHKSRLLRREKGFWVYIATNGRLLRPEVADRLVTQVFLSSTSPWIPGTSNQSAKALVPAQKNLEHILRKQYVDGYLVFSI